jgi:ACT domain-containing protein
MLREEFEDIKGVSRICKSKKDRQLNDQIKKDKQRSTKHYIYRLNISKFQEDNKPRRLLLSILMQQILKLVYPNNSNQQTLYL